MNNTGDVFDSLCSIELLGFLSTKIIVTVETNIQYSWAQGRAWSTYNGLLMHVLASEGVCWVERSVMPDRYSIIVMLYFHAMVFERGARC